MVEKSPEYNDLVIGFNSIEESGLVIEEFYGKIFSLIADILALEFEKIEITTQHFNPNPEEGLPSRVLKVELPSEFEIDDVDQFAENLSERMEKIKLELHNVSYKGRIVLPLQHLLDKTNELPAPTYRPKD